MCVRMVDVWVNVLEVGREDVWVIGRKDERMDDLWCMEKCWVCG